MRPTTVTVGPLAAASATNIATSQTPTTSVTLNGSTVTGGVATLDTPRRILITNGASEASNVFTITGTGLNGTAQVEALNGAASAFYSNLDFLTVSSITLKVAASGTITVGTNGIASSQWVRLDDYAPGLTSIQCTASGTVNYTIQSTLQDPNSPTNSVLPYSVVWVNTSDAVAVGATASLQSNFQFAPIFAKVLLNSGTGSVSTVFLQSSNGPI